MAYFITFLEGIISFISPCMLPMLPLYLAYFSGDDGKKSNRVINSVLFFIGFTIIFCLMGAFASTIGTFLVDYRKYFNIIFGIIIILFGLNYLGIFNLKLFKGVNKNVKINNPFSAFVFGVIFATNLTPCVGAYLGSALMLAASSSSAIKGIVMLLIYSIGIGIPFILSAFLIEKLKNTFDFIKKNYKVINIVCGALLVVIGILMMFGLLNKFLI